MFDDLLPVIFYLTLGMGIGLAVPALFEEISPTALPANFLDTQKIIATFNSQKAQIGKLTSELDALKKEKDNLQVKYNAIRESKMPEPKTSYFLLFSAFLWGMIFAHPLSTFIRKICKGKSNPNNETRNKSTTL